MKKENIVFSFLDNKFEMKRSKFVPCFIFKYCFPIKPMRIEKVYSKKFSLLPQMSQLFHIYEILKIFDIS